MDGIAASSSSSSTSAPDFDPTQTHRHARSGFSSDSSSSRPKLKQKQRTPRQESSQPTPTGSPFDMLAWYPNYLSCQRYFINHSQHDSLVQMFAALLNILLPFQREPPVFSTRGASSAAELQSEIVRQRQEVFRQAEPSTVCVSLIPYVRRLVATGMDAVQVLHGFFGNDWQNGIGPQQETERRNFLLAARSMSWSEVKQHYDISPYETIPFLRPLTHVHREELEAAERSWSDWQEMVTVSSQGFVPKSKPATDGSNNDA